MENLLLAIFLILFVIALLGYGIYSGLDCWLGELKEFYVPIVGGHKEMGMHEGHIHKPDRYWFCVQMPHKQIEVETNVVRWHNADHVGHVKVLASVGKWSGKYYFPELI